jgi:hypothetical protein
VYAEYIRNHQHKENTMTVMTDTEAREIIEQLGGAAIADFVALHHRIAELKADYAKDPWEDTKVQIDRLEARQEKRRLEADALAIALNKFGGTTATRETHDVKAAWNFVLDSYDGQAYSPVRSEWTDEDIFDFARTCHIGGLDAFKKEGGK